MNATHAAPFALGITMESAVRGMGVVSSRWYR